MIKSNKIRLIYYESIWLKFMTFTYNFKFSHYPSSICLDVIQIGPNVNGEQVMSDEHENF